MKITLQQGRELMEALGFNGAKKMSAEKLASRFNELSEVEGMDEAEIEVNDELQELLQQVLDANNEGKEIEVVDEEVAPAKGKGKKEAKPAKKEEKKAPAKKAAAKEEEEDEEEEEEEDEEEEEEEDEEEESVPVKKSKKDAKKSKAKKEGKPKKAKVEKPEGTLRGCRGRQRLWAAGAVLKELGLSKTNDITFITQEMADKVDELCETANTTESVADLSNARSSILGFIGKPLPTKE